LKPGVPLVIFLSSFSLFPRFAYAMLCGLNIPNSDFVLWVKKIFFLHVLVKHERISEKINSSKQDAIIVEIIIDQ